MESAEDNHTGSFHVELCGRFAPVVVGARVAAMKIGSQLNNTVVVPLRRSPVGEMCAYPSFNSDRLSSFSAGANQPDGIPPSSIKLNAGGASKNADRDSTPWRRPLCK